MSEGKHAFNDEESSIERVEIEKHLTREREDFLGGDRGTQLVDNRVSELCCIYSRSVIVHSTNTVTWVSHF